MSKQKPINAQCPTCLGRGQVQLSKKHASTYLLLKIQGEISVEGLHEADTSVAQGALYQRLKALIKLKLVTRRKQGKTYLYQVKKGK